MAVPIPTLGMIATIRTLGMIATIRNNTPVDIIVCMPDGRWTRLPPGVTAEIWELDQQDAERQK